MDIQGIGYTKVMDISQSFLLVCKMLSVIIFVLLHHKKITVDS